MKKIFKILALILLIGVLTLHFYIPRIITEIKHPLTEVDFTEIKLPEDIETKYFMSFDGHKQYYNLRYTNQVVVKGTIILLHGIRSRKEQYLELSKYLSLRGYNTVALDLRAHGSSEGVHCTFGVKEKRDVASLIDELYSLGLENNLGVWGQSLGGAVAIQSTAFDNRIRFAIVESTFTDLEIIITDYMELNLGFRSKTLSHYLVSRAGKIAKFNPSEAAPLISCKEISVPVLMVHGNNDKRINIKYGRANFQNLNSINKQFLEVENATHLNVWQVGGEVYFNQVFKFLKTVNKNNL